VNPTVKEDRRQDTENKDAGKKRGPADVNRGPSVLPCLLLPVSYS
jgi:hypothetical protein